MKKYRAYLFEVNEFSRQPGITKQISKKEGKLSGVAQHSACHFPRDLMILGLARKAKKPERGWPLIVESFW